MKSITIKRFRILPTGALAATLTTALTVCLAGLALAKPPTKPAALAAAPVEKIDYNRDIRPILSDKCFTCHGQDPAKLQAGLRLDVREIATSALASGGHAIVPGHPESSGLIRRINAHDDLQMPPASSNKVLSVSDRALLKAWIAQGAVYKRHWAYVAPVRPPLPVVHDTAWPKNAIDSFILAKLEKEGLKPSPAADRTTLLRRVSIDLTGLPATPDEIDTFLADKSPNAYEKVVDRLLASPRYGEQMAATWLDGARYADSNGFQGDYQRQQYRWRDWVIDAFNQNLPYDQFAVDQLAGDLLPNATLSQKIATGFNRNHRINGEGGIIPEEWRTENVIDRVETTSAVFLGLTMGCARCHDHKYDPIPQKDFYRFCAYFNSNAESGVSTDGVVNTAPIIKSPTPDQEKQLAALTAKVADLGAQVSARESAASNAGDGAARAALTAADERLDNGLLIDFALTSAPGGAVISGKPVFEPASNAYSTGTATFDGRSFIDTLAMGNFERDQAFSYGGWINPKTGNGSPIARMDATDKSYRGWDIYVTGGRVFVHIINHFPDNALKVASAATLPLGKWSHVFVTYDGSSEPEGIKIYVNGKPVEHTTENNSLTGTIRTLRPLRIGGRFGADPFAGQADDMRVYTRVIAPDEALALAELGPLRPILATAADKRTDAQKLVLARYTLHATDPSYGELSDDHAAAVAARDAFDNSIPTTMIMQEMPKPKQQFVLIRGQYDHPGEPVDPAIPAVFGALPAGTPNNRLGLARWIVSPENPLTARVAVNRYWEKFFGTGIVATSEDFGVRAEFPSHPELLDYLATEFVRLHWDVKAMLKEIVMSATYQQSSRISPALLHRDPENRLLARGPRLRLPAEVIRDQALAACGLLVEKVGGPSVRPYQPDGLWDELSVYGDLRNYKHDKGDGLYRRTLYTIYKRTVPPPLMSTFDVPPRDTCRVRRSRTNTPLQALELLNDETFVEASRVLAQKMMTDGGATPQDRLTYGFRRLLGRRPTARELAILTGGVQQRLTHYRADVPAATAVVSVGDSPRPAGLDIPELAAYTTAVSVILNLDETITKE